MKSYGKSSEKEKTVCLLKFCFAVHTSVPVEKVSIHFYNPLLKTARLIENYYLENHYKE